MLWSTVPVSHLQLRASAASSLHRRLSAASGTQRESGGCPSRPDSRTSRTSLTSRPGTPESQTQRQQPPLLPGKPELLLVLAAKPVGLLDLTLELV